MSVVMAALHPARILKTTVAVYVAALFATAPFTGTGPLEAAPAPAEAAASAHLSYLPGVEVDVITFATPVAAYDVAAQLPPNARVVSMVGIGPDGGSAGVTIPDGLPLAGALAALGPEVASIPVTSVAIARI